MHTGSTALALEMQVLLAELERLRAELAKAKRELGDRNQEYELIAWDFRNYQTASANLIGRLADILERRLQFAGPWKEESLVSEARQAIAGLKVNSALSITPGLKPGASSLFR